MKSRKPHYAALSSVVEGNTYFGNNTNVWHGAVIRGDENTIEIGNNTNIQDGCVLHTDHDHPLKVGSNVTVGHRAILHGCTVEDDALIGMGSIILDGAIIGKGAMVAAGALVPPGMQVPAKCVVMGVPAKIVRSVSDEEVAANLKNANDYSQRAKISLQKLEFIEEDL